MTALRTLSGSEIDTAHFGIFGGDADHITRGSLIHRRQGELGRWEQTGGGANKLGDH